jgi:hypothetical protein
MDFDRTIKCFLFKYLICTATVCLPVPDTGTCLRTDLYMKMEWMKWMNETLGMELK